MAMTCSETQTWRLLRKTANLLNSVAEAAWSSDFSSPAKWDLHRIGSEAYPAPVLTCAASARPHARFSEFEVGFARDASRPRRAAPGSRQSRADPARELASAGCPDLGVPMMRFPDDSRYGGGHEPQICHYR
jgi:hypothetical protein